MGLAEISDFTGGIATAIAPHLLPSNESVVNIDIDIRRGTLRSIPLSTLVKPLDGRYFYLFNGVVYSYNTLRSNVKWNNTWYWADGAETKKMLPDGTVKDLGMDTPTNILTLTQGTATHPLTGNFTYVFTFYDSVLGVESAPSALSNYLTVTNADINVGGFPTTWPAEATHFRLYRIGGYLSEFTLVDTIPVGSLTYLDGLDVTQIDGRLLQTLRTGVPPTGLKFLVELNGRLFGAVDNYVYYASLGTPDSWYVDDYYIVSDTITGLATCGAGLVIFSANATNVLRGSDPSNFFMKELSSNVGCISHFSIAQYQDSIIWLSTDAFNMTDGFSIKDLTSHKVKNINGMYPRGTVVKNLSYLMSFSPMLTPSTELLPSTSFYPNDVIDGSGMGEGIVVINFNFGRLYSYSLLSGSGIGNLGIVNSVLMHSAMRDSYGGLYDIYRESTGLRSFKYTSAMMVDGSYATLKEYEKVRIIYNGAFEVSIILDGTGIVLRTKITNADSKDGFIVLGIPKSRNKGYGIQFTISGVGEIRSIQYSTVPRSLP